jgi:hypothetical protein
MRPARLPYFVAVALRHVGMDRRVKPGGDEGEGAQRRLIAFAA